MQPASSDSGTTSGCEIVPMGPPLKEKKKVGRPITYKGDVNSKDLTEAERRRIKRCNRFPKPSRAVTADLVQLPPKALLPYVAADSASGAQWDTFMCRNCAWHVPAAQPLTYCCQLQAGGWPTGSRRGGCGRSGRRLWRRCSRAWTRCRRRRRRCRRGCRRWSSTRLCCWGSSRRCATNGPRRSTRTCGCSTRSLAAAAPSRCA